MRTTQGHLPMTVLALLTLLAGCQCSSPNTTNPDDSTQLDSNGHTGTQTDSPDSTGVDTNDTNDTEDTGPEDPLPPGAYRFELETPDGRNRLYEIHVPANLDQSSPAPVVFNLHGGGGSAEMTPYYTQMNPTADAHGFVVVYPQGIQSEGADQYNPLATWNATTDCCGDAVAQNVDDVEYFRSVLAELHTRIWVDESRVYATGFSNGGMMSYRLACEASDLFAAIAPVAAPGSDWAGCALARAVPVLHIHGAEDSCASFTGGTDACGGCLQTYNNTVFGTDIDPVVWTCESIPDTVADWRALDGCPQGNGIETYQQGEATCRSWTPCASNSEVTLCTVNDMGHAWPGGNHIEVCETHPDNTFCLAWIEIVGEISTDISNEEIWAFFSRHSLN